MVRLNCPRCGVIETTTDGLLVVATEGGLRLDYQCSFCGTKGHRLLDSRLAAALRTTDALLTLGPDCERERG